MTEQHKHARRWRKQEGLASETGPWRTRELYHVFRIDPYYHESVKRTPSLTVTQIRKRMVQAALEVTRITDLLLTVPPPLAEAVSHGLGFGFRFGAYGVW